MRDTAAHSPLSWLSTARVPSGQAHVAPSKRTVSSGLHGKGEGGPHVNRSTDA